VLTIFSAPKAFQGHLAIIQENALRSWLRLRPRPEVILFGDEPNVAETARSLGARHVDQVAANSHGTPLVSDMFKQADSLAAGEIVAFVSADIILTQSLVEAARTVAAWSKRFLLVAQRHDVDVRTPIDFDEDWEQRGARGTLAAGKLHSPGAIDLFLYARGQYSEMPPFAIGRTSYDNWLLWYTVQSGIPLVDATDFVTLIHQNHDYSHAIAHDVWHGQEARENRKLIGDWTHYYSIAHATWTLSKDGTIARAAGWKYRTARQRQLLSHALRASRPLRTRIRSWRIARRFAR
jgi:hypothetical protein